MFCTFSHVSRSYHTTDESETKMAYRFPVVEMSVSHFVPAIPDRSQVAELPVVVPDPEAWVDPFGTSVSGVVSLVALRGTAVSVPASPARVVVFDPRTDQPIPAPSNRTTAAAAARGRYRVRSGTTVPCATAIAGGCDVPQRCRDLCGKILDCVVMFVHFLPSDPFSSLSRVVL
jgi:hypothetical protein